MSLGDRSDPNRKTDYVSKRKDLPSVDAPNYDQKVRETVSTYLGLRGDALDKGMTLRDIVSAGLVTLSADGKTIVGAGTIITDLIVDKYVVDTTPPPMPTGFTADAAFTTILIQHDGAAYKEGNGHSHTNIYGVTYSSGALPQFSDAVKLTEFKGSVFSYPTNPATTWHLWATWVTNDGVESTSPAGGINGVVVTTGQDIALLLKSLNSSIGVTQLAKALSTAISDSTAGVDYLGTQNGIRVQATSDGKTVIGGFGVMGSTADAAGPTIDFGVMANRFYVAAPSTASGVVSSIPFVIQTTPVQATGSTPAIPAGIYMDEAFIKNASITSAKIGSVNADSISTGVLKAVVNQSGAIYNGVPAYSMTQDPVTKVWSSTRTNWNPENNTGSGYYLGSLDGSPTFFVGNAINNMTYSGTTLKVKGEIYADKGTFGGIIIGSHLFNNQEVGHIRSIGKSTMTMGSGLYIDASGNFSLGDSVNKLVWNGSSLRISGEINVGDYDSYNWPAAGGTGVHLSKNGLLMGNRNPSPSNPQGRFYQVSTTPGGVPFIDTNIPAYIESLEVGKLTGAINLITPVNFNSNYAVNTHTYVTVYEATIPANSVHGHSPQSVLTVSLGTPGGQQFAAKFRLTVGSAQITQSVVVISQGSATLSLGCPFSHINTQVKLEVTLADSYSMPFAIGMVSGWIGGFR